MAEAMRQESPDIWHPICRLDQIPPRGARTIEVGGRSIAVFRTSDDGIFALRDRCPHRGGPLSQGIVHGHCVTCPLHDWVIELATGEARAPDEGRTERYPVRLDGEVVMLGVPAEAAPQTKARVAAEAAPQTKARVAAEAAPQTNARIAAGR